MNNNTFFKDLKASLEDAIAYKKGKLNLRSTEIEIPEPSVGKRHQKKKNVDDETLLLVVTYCCTPHNNYS